MKKPMKIILKYAIIFICLIILFTVLLTLTSMIPRENIEENAKESAEILAKQTDKLYIPVREWLMYFDNFTDALMVNTAYSIDENTPFYSAMVARRNYIPGVTKNIYEDRKGELGSFDIYDENELKQTEELYKTVNGDIENSFEYARYWHGYLVLLRPALLLANIGEIRAVLICVFIMLLLILAILLIKKVGIFYSIAIVARNYRSRLFIYWDNTTKYAGLSNNDNIKYCNSINS